MNTRTSAPGKRADLDSILDFCCTEILAGRLTLESCLRLYPAQAAQLRPLLAVVLQISSISPIMMRPEARDALERKLREHAARLRVLRAAPARPQATLLRWLAAAAALVIVAVTGAGTVAAAAASVPGDLLYPVKRWSESVTLQVSSERDQAYLRLEWAQRRLNEFRALANAGDLDVDLLQELERETAAALAASEALDETDRAGALGQIAALQEIAIEVMVSVRDQLPASERSRLDSTLAAMTVQRERALNHLLPAVTPQPAATRTPSPSFEASETGTPPSQGTPGAGLTQTPSGRGTPGSGLTSTPPGQGTPGSGQSVTPPGQGTPGDGGPPDPPPTHEPKPVKTPKP